MSTTRVTGRRRYLLRLAAGLGTVALLTALLPFDQLAAAIRRIEPATWPLALVVFLGVHALSAAKWRLLMAAAGARVTYRQAARCHAAGLFGNLFLPSVVGGDMVRAGLALRFGRPRAAILLGSFVDRGCDVAALGSLAGVGALGMHSALDPASRSIFLAVLGLGAAGAAATTTALLVLPVNRLPPRARRAMARARSAVRQLRRRPGALAGAATLALVSQSALVALNAGLGVLVGVDVSPFAWLLVWPLAKLAALVPITQGGLGVREAALVGLFRPLGVEPVTAMAAGLAFEAVLVTGGLVSGAIAWALSGGSRLVYSDAELDPDEGERALEK